MASSRVKAFGSSAERYARRLPASIPVVIGDASLPAQALKEAVDTRFSGTTFFAAPLLDDNRTLVAQGAAHHLLSNLRDADALRFHFNALAAEQLTINGINQREVQAHEAKVIDTLSDMVMVADALLVRSCREHARLRSVLRKTKQHVVAAPGVDTTIPAGSSDRSGGVVVWAAMFDASQLGVIAYALDQLHAQATIICASGQLPHTRARFVALADAKDALAHASVVVDANISDASSAIALARWGAPLVCASTSGADEFLSGVILYDPWDWNQLHTAVSAAKASAPASAQADPLNQAEIDATLEAARPPQLEHQPLVSIIVPAYNRPDLLDICLREFEKQTYKNFEVIVVNDGGTPLDEVTSKYPRVRLVNRLKNGGPVRAENTGLGAVLGEYVLFCGDDDYFFPDTLARFVTAFASSDAPAVTSNGVIGFVRSGDGGKPVVLGHRWHTYMCLEWRQELWGGAITMVGVMFRRDAFTRFGLLDEENRAADYEFMLRIASGNDLPYVDAVTFYFTYKMDAKGFSHAAGNVEEIKNDYRAIWQRFGSQGSADIERRRLESLQWLERGSQGHYWEPAIYLPEEV